MAITSRALAFASRWFDPQTVARVFNPLVADWQREWIDASKSRRSIVHLKGFTAFCLAMVVSSPEVFKAAVPPLVAKRIAWRIALVVSILSAVLLIPAVAYHRPSEPPLVYVILLLPSAIALSLPFAMTSAVDAIRGDRGVSPNIERAVAFKLSLVAVLFMIVFGGWIVPASNQAWRVAMNPAGMRAPLRGERELTTSELLFAPDRMTMFAPDAVTPRSRLIRRELSNRGSLIILPLVLIWARWTALNGRRRWRLIPLPASLATVVTIVAFGLLWTAGVTIELQGLLPWTLGLWLPPLGLASLAALGCFVERLVHPREA